MLMNEGNTFFLIQASVTSPMRTGKPNSRYVNGLNWLEAEYNRLEMMSCFNLLYIVCIWTVLQNLQSFKI